MSEAGTLYVVSTPIGNLEDITIRALRILRETDIIAAEDTRHTSKLIAYHGIRARLLTQPEDGLLADLDAAVLLADAL